VSATVTVDGRDRLVDEPLDAGADVPRVASGADKRRRGGGVALPSGEGGETALTKLGRGEAASGAPAGWHPSRLTCARARALPAPGSTLGQPWGEDANHYF
jgi:hypothetical protein